MQNKKLRKALAVSMAIAMTGGLLAGCGSNNSSSSNGGAAKSGSTSSASGELDTSEFVELSMYVISDRPAGQDAIDENLNKLLKEKLNCSLKLTGSAGQSTQTNIRCCSLREKSLIWHTVHPG